MWREIFKLAIIFLGMMGISYLREPRVSPSIRVLLCMGGGLLIGMAANAIKHDAVAKTLLDTTSIVCEHMNSSQGSANQ